MIDDSTVKFPDPKSKQLQQNFHISNVNNCSNKVKYEITYRV